MRRGMPVWRCRTASETIPSARPTGTAPHRGTRCCSTPAAVTVRPGRRGPPAAATAAQGALLRWPPGLAPARLAGGPRQGHQRRQCRPLRCRRGRRRLVCPDREARLGVRRRAHCHHARASSASRSACILVPTGSMPALTRDLRVSRPGLRRPGHVLGGVARSPHRHLSGPRGRPRTPQDRLRSDGTPECVTRGSQARA